MEEAKELMERLESGGPSQFTSCAELGPLL